MGLLSLLCALPLLALAEDRFEAEPINYSRATPVNAISRLQEGIENGTVALDFDPQSGYLKPVLAALGIASESQVLVFSKTSFQNDYISPTTPRAIYFNDDSYVGTVQHGNVIEISTADPELGAVFYALRQEQTGRPEFVRQGHECLQCHASALTNNLPGHVVRSVYTDAKGFPLFGAGTHLTTQSSPFEERWGGWYVTGTHGAARHLGNTLARATENGAEFDPEAGANRTALDPRVDAGRYLTPHSDIVALMVLEHQTQMHNLITEAGFHTRMALRDQAVMDKILNRAPDILSESTQRRIASAGDKLVRHMLFVDEVELDDPIVGTSGYTERFAALGPFDGQGRSLREFDLESRLFKYPLSYLIYSPQFDGLPEEMKGYVYQRLWGILTGVENTPDYLHLTNAKSRAIREILLATKPGLPAYWTAGQG
ncbi:MAG: hypothetical protein HYV27_24000 [Candidatus Hydrogenedentes bacterium]|nr:hypothetical protein [Candidatus Hydrogenedentota bacterium]